MKIESLTIVILLAGAVLGQDMSPARNPRPASLLNEILQTEDPTPSRETKKKESLSPKTQPPASRKPPSLQGNPTTPGTFLADLSNTADQSRDKRTSPGLATPSTKAKAGTPRKPELPAERKAGQENPADAETFLNHLATGENAPQARPTRATTALSPKTSPFHFVGNLFNPKRRPSDPFAAEQTDEESSRRRALIARLEKVIQRKGKSAAAPAATPVTSTVGKGFLSLETLEQTGFELLWTQDRPANWPKGSQVRRLDVTQDFTVLSTSLEEVVAYSVDKGEFAWTYQNPQAIDYGPIFTPEGMYFIAQGFVYCVSAPESGTYTWRRLLEFPVLSAPIPYQSYLIMPVYPNRIVFYHRKRRLADYSYPIYGRLSGPPSVYRDDLFFGNDSGTLYRLSLGTKMNYIWKSSGRRREYTAPVAIDTSSTPPRIFLATTDRQIVAVNLLNGNDILLEGAVPWSVFLEGPVTQAPIPQGDDLLLAVADDAGLYGFDRQKATDRWFVPHVTSVVSRNPVEAFCLTTSNEILAVEMKTGTVLWKHPLAPYRFGAASEDGKTTFLASPQGDLCALRTPWKEPPPPAEPQQEVGEAKKPGETTEAKEPEKTETETPEEKTPAPTKEGDKTDKGDGGEEAPASVPEGE